MALSTIRFANDYQESLRAEAAQRRLIRQPSLRQRLVSVLGFARLAFGAGGGYAPGSIIPATH
ncbi:MAG TPA: hypothetical protein VD763_09180 [Candidatus Saccharimonadales bacterium]|nr:hypothetical protein [Candidatus Saccharimonadales bacterium]